MRTTILLTLVLSLSNSCAVYHDGSRVNGVFGASGTVANTYAATNARASDAGIDRCDELVEAYQPGDTVRCQDAAGFVYIGPPGGLYGSGGYYTGYYNNGVVGRQYPDEIDWAAAVSREYQRAQAAEESARILMANPPPAE